MDKLIVVFSGYNQRAVIAFLRTLNEIQVDNYALIACGDSDLIFKTKYSNKVEYVRLHKKLTIEEFSAIANVLKEKYGEVELIIAPSTEAINRFALMNRSKLMKFGFTIPLVEEDLYNKISDKDSFGDLCREWGILVPKTLGMTRKFIKPVVAKPKKYFTKDNEVFSPVIIQSQKELDWFYERYKTDGFFFQEFINGESHYLLFYFSKNGDFYVYSQENHAQQLNGKSIIAARGNDLYQKQDVVSAYTRMFTSVNFWGLVMVEIRKSGDSFYMIEANPRFWGPSQLFCDSGYNLFVPFLVDAGIINTIAEIAVCRDATYLWSGAIAGELLRTKDCVWYGDGRTKVEQCSQLYQEWDMYKREDTIEIYKIETR